MSTPDFFWSDERFHDLFKSTYSELDGSQGQGRNDLINGDDHPAAIPLQVAVYKADVRGPLPYDDSFFYQTAGKIYSGNAELGLGVQTIVELSNSPSGSPASVYSLFGRGIDVDSLNQKLYFVVYEIENMTSLVPERDGSEDQSVFDSNGNAFISGATVTCKIRRCDFDGSNLEDFETITRAGRVYEHIYFPSTGGYETIAFVEDFEYGALKFNNAHRDWALANPEFPEQPGPIKEECYWSEWVVSLADSIANSGGDQTASIHKRNLLNSSSQVVYGDLLNCQEFCLDSHNRSLGSGHGAPTIYIADYYPLGGLPLTVGGEASSVPYYQISRTKESAAKQVMLFTGMKNTGDQELDSSFSHLHCLDMHYVSPKEATDPQVNYDSTLQLDPDSLYLTGAVLLGPPTAAPNDLNLQYHVARIDVKSDQYEFIGNLGNTANGLVEGLSSFWNFDEVVDTVPQVDSLGATAQVGQTRSDTVGSSDFTTHNSSGSVPSLSLHQSTSSGTTVNAGFNVTAIAGNSGTTWCRGESGVWAVSIRIPGPDIPGWSASAPLGCIFELGSTNAGCYLGFNDNHDLVWRAGSGDPAGGGAEPEDKAKIVISGLTLPRDKTIHLLCEIRDQSGMPGLVRIWMDSGNGYSVLGEAETLGGVSFATFSWAVNFNGGVGLADGNVVRPELKQRVSGVDILSEVKYWPATLVGKSRSGSYYTTSDVYRVTTLNATGPGSLLNGLEYRGDTTRHIVFDVSGVIEIPLFTGAAGGHPDAVPVAWETNPSSGLGWFYGLYGAGNNISAPDPVNSAGVPNSNVPAPAGPKNIVVHGDTSPNGIIITGAPMGFVDSENITIKHITWIQDEAPGDGSKANSWNPLKLLSKYGSNKNFTLEHCGVFGGDDENDFGSWWNARYTAWNTYANANGLTPPPPTSENLVVKNCIFGYGTTAHRGNHNFSLGVSYAKNITIEGNIFVHNNRRNPQVFSAKFEQLAGGVISNNVTYNYGTMGLGVVYGGYDIVNNFFKQGTNTTTSQKAMEVTQSDVSSPSDTLSLYLNSNESYTRTPVGSKTTIGGTLIGSDWNVFAYPAEITPNPNGDPTKVERSSPIFDIPTYRTYGDILQSAGTTFQHPLELASKSDLENGAGKWINNFTSPGGFSTYAVSQGFATTTPIDTLLRSHVPSDVASHPPLAAWAAVRDIGVVPPLNNDALDCSIQTTYLSVPENTKINRNGAGTTGDITIAAWVYLLSTDDCTVVSKGLNGCEYVLYVKDQKAGLKLTDSELYPSTTEVIFSVENPDLLEVGKWHLLVGTIKKNSRMGVSVNGTTRTNANNNGWGHLSKTPGDLIVGWNEIPTATWGYNFPGYIDQLAIWDRELADNEIADFYNNGISATTAKHVRAFDIRNNKELQQRPAALKDTFWSGAQTNKARLYLQSGQFSSTVVTSLANPVWGGDVGIAMSSPSGIEWDGTNTLWTDSGIDFSSGLSKRNLYKSSGVLTSTLKESQSVGLVNTDVYGISSLSDKSATPWAGHKVGESSKLYLQSGQFTSTLKVSLDVSSVDLKCNDVSWAGPLSAASSIPSTTGDALWSGGDGNKLYSVSGLFSSTIKDSQDVSNHDRANTGVSWDGTNTLWSSNETNKLLLMSGRFSRTVKTSLQVGAINDAPTGISTYDVDGRLSSGGASTYVGTGVIRDGLKSLTVSGTGQFSHTVPATGEKVYITDYAATSSDALISTIDLDGFGRETVLTGPGDARDIVIDMGAKKIFWAEVSQNSVGTRTGAVHDAIFSADLGGNGKTELADIMANKRSDEVSASAVGLAIDKARKRIFFMTRAVLSSPQANPDSGATYPVRINLLVVNYDGTYNGQPGPHYFKVGNPLLRGWLDDPGRDDEMIPAKMKYVEPSTGYPSGRLFYLTRTRTENEDPGYDIGGSKNRYGSEILYIDLHTDEVTTCYWHGDNIRSFDVDAKNNSIYLGRHTYHPTTRVTDGSGNKYDFPGWGEEPSADLTGIRSPKSRLERLDYKNNSFKYEDRVSHFVHKDSYLLQDYGGVGSSRTERIANFGKTPDPSAGNVTNQQFRGQVTLAFQEWKNLFEQEFPGLTLNFQDLGVETGLPPRMDVYGPDATNPPNPNISGQFVYDIPNGSYFGFPYDRVGDIRVAMHKFTAKSLVSGNTLAHGYYPQNLLDSLGSKGSFAGDLHFDVDDNWRIDSDPISGSVSTSPISILYVAAHEIGHSLGIRHDSDADSLMAPVVRSSFANNIGHLVDSQADILAVQFLYGSDSSTPSNGSTQELPRRNQWTKLRNAIKKLQNGQSTSETITFTYSYMPTFPDWVIEASDGRYSRSPIVALASDIWDIPSDLTLDIDNEFIYVSDYGAGQALRFDLDGSNRTELTAINIGDFSGLALLAAESNIYAAAADLETERVKISGNATYYAPFTSGGSDLEITKVACDGAASYKNAPRLPKLTVSAIGKFTFVGIAKAAEAALPSLGTTGQGTHTNPPSYDRPTDDIYYHNRNDSLVPHHGWNQLGFNNKYDVVTTCPRTEHTKAPFTPTDLVVNDGCNLDKDGDASVDIPVRNTNVTTESPLNSSDSNASRVAKSVALMNQLNSQGLNTGRKSKLKRNKSE